MKTTIVALWVLSHINEKPGAWWAEFCRMNNHDVVCTTYRTYSSGGLEKRVCTNGKCEIKTITGRKNEKNN